MFTQYSFCEGGFGENSKVPAEDIQITNSVDFFLTLERKVDKANTMLGSFVGQMEKEKEALAMIQSAAERGFAEALHLLGILHQTGRAGLPENYEIARKCYLQSAEQKPYLQLANFPIPNYNKVNHGVTDSQNTLGVFYRDGLGVEKNYDEAFKWFFKAAHYGNADAQNNLAKLYVYGQGCEQNLINARVWFNYAAENDHAEAKYHLAKMLILGFRVFAVPDYETAAKLLQECAAVGHRGALTHLQWMGRTGLVKASDADEWIFEREAKGDPEAQGPHFN